MKKLIHEEKSSVVKAKTITGSLAIMLLSNPASFVQFWFHHRGESDVVAASILRMGESMAVIYGDVFKKLSKTHRITINSSSNICPSASIVNNEIQIGNLNYAI